MCGITGWVDFKRSLLGEQGTVKKMAETLEKRGPDDTNVWVQQHAAFGHKRLVVVDPQGGKQPMTRQKEQKNIRFAIMVSFIIQKIFAKSY